MTDVENLFIEEMTEEDTMDAILPDDIDTIIDNYEAKAGSIFDDDEEDDEYEPDDYDYYSN